MHFQEIKDKYYSILIDRLYHYIPSFKSVFDSDDGVYPILGEFGCYLLENSLDINLLLQSTRFINEAYREGGSETDNAISLQIFEQVAVDEKIRKLFSQELNEKAACEFERYI